MSHRTEQVASTIERALQDQLARGLSDPRVKGLITITGVRVTDDLKTAIVRVSVLPVEHQELTMHGLKSAARHIRHQIADRLAMKRTPELVFELDESLKRQAGVLDALAKVAAERRERGDAADASDEEGT